MQRAAEEVVLVDVVEVVVIGTEDVVDFEDELVVE